MRGNAHLLRRFTPLRGSRSHILAGGTCDCFSTITVDHPFVSLSRNLTEICKLWISMRTEGLSRGGEMEVVHRMATTNHPDMIRFYAVLGPHSIPDQLPPTPHNLPVITLLWTGHPNTPQHPLGQKIGLLPTVPAVRLDPVAILLRHETRWRHNTVCPIPDNSIMKPKPKIACLIHHMNRIAPDTDPTTSVTPPNGPVSSH